MTDAYPDSLVVSRSQHGRLAQPGRHRSVRGRFQGALHQVQLLQRHHDCRGRLRPGHQLDLLLGAKEHLFQRRLQGVGGSSGGKLKGTASGVTLLLQTIDDVKQCCTFSGPWGSDPLSWLVFMKYCMVIISHLHFKDISIGIE